MKTISTIRLAIDVYTEKKGYAPPFIILSRQQYFNLCCQEGFGLSNYCDIMKHPMTIFGVPFGISGDEDDFLDFSKVEYL